MKDSREWRHTVCNVIQSERSCHNPLSCHIKWNLSNLDTTRKKVSYE